MNRFKSEHKKHRAKTKRFQNRCPIRLLQLSTAGEVFCVYYRDTACRVRQLCQGEIPLKTFHRNVFKIRIQQMGHRAERSCSLRPRKAVAFLTHLLRVPRSMGTGNFAVCGQRLRGHVPSKNTSPTVLSWISLTSPTISVLFVSARCERIRQQTLTMFHVKHPLTLLSASAPVQRGRPYRRTPAPASLYSSHRSRKPAVPDGSPD